jgi:CRP-like cAMP-binding protein
MTPYEGAAVLRTTGWLSTTPVEFQDTLLGLCRWRWFEPEETIVMAGNEQSPVVGIASGTAAVVTSLGPPDTPLTHISHAGWWVGYVPLVSGQPTENTTVAKSPVFAAVAAQSAVFGLLDQHPRWWKCIAGVTLFYARAATNIAADLLIRDSERRCAATLLRIANCRFDGDAPAIAAVNQSDLASIANLSRTTASALLGKFESSSILARHYNYIEILDPWALREIADGN